MSAILVRPDLHHQFGARNPQFCLVVDSANKYGIGMDGQSSLYHRTSQIALHPGESLETFLATRAPREADILVVTPGTFLSSPGASVIGEDRKLSVVPCASTPVTAAQLSYFLEICESIDHDSVAARSDAILEALNLAESVRIVDARRGTSASFGSLGDYDWNVQAGVLSGGEQQIAPNGELSAVPLDIMHFDAERRLDLCGQIAMSGTVIVHRGGNESDEDEQARLYARLAAATHGDAVVLDIDHGRIVGVRPHGPEAKPAVEALEELFQADSRYQIVWEFGLGLNDGIKPVGGNCGLNEVCGGRGAQLHIGIGLTPWTKFALTFHCADSLVQVGEAVLAEPLRRSMTRRRGPACGCDEGARGVW
ncbi:hypothetical protein [Nocardia camponoti]|uniref:Crocagin biosynthetic protein CgnE/B domain-containing protein n=1 Tax=Nocardia camponoti TaxID=1616106 RepID=A0A917VCN8_9NOCA|nr:hypothetical protein [Nocardia camponoti]GGK63275.1 hypothetical protein GCM10011591_39440 [Nocardia camponoti]